MMSAFAVQIADRIAVFFARRLRGFVMLMRIGETVLPVIRINVDGNAEWFKIASNTDVSIILQGYNGRWRM